MWHLLQGRRRHPHFLSIFCMLVVAIAADQIVVVDHMQEPSLTFSHAYGSWTTPFNLIDESQGNYFVSNQKLVGDWVRIEFPEPIEITTVYLLCHTKDWATGGDSSTLDFMRVDIYAGPNLDYTLNTLCASYVLPEGIFNCNGGVLGQYITLVVV